MFPLNETNGIIEWVDNLQPFRIILAKLYRQLLGPKKIMKSEEIKKCAATLKDAKDDLKKFKYLLERHPSVFAEWFVRNFPDPQAWFTARLSYTRTTAVMVRDHLLKDFKKLNFDHHLSLHCFRAWLATYWALEVSYKKKSD